MSEERQKHTVQLEIISGYRNKIVMDNLQVEDILSMLDSDYEYLEQENALISTNELLAKSETLKPVESEKECPHKEGAVYVVHECTDCGLKEILPLSEVAPEYINQSFYSLPPAPVKDVPAMQKVNRVEVIDGKGRSYVNWNEGNKVEVSYQDDGRTMKIFITS